MGASRGLIGALATLIVALAGLNVWQWSSRSATPAAAPAQAAKAKPARRQILDGYAKLAFIPVLQNRWFGVHTWQNPNDVWITQEILWEVKPDFLVETGTHEGGSAAMWATFLEQINPGARVVTIDIEDKVTAAKELAIVQQRVDFLVGSSTAPEIVAEVKRLVAGGKVLVILDSDHSRDHVLRELELYSPLVPVGSYLIVQDTSANGHPLLPDHGPGPWEAVQAFVSKNKSFRPDRGRERLLFTLHPNGYLKRIR